MIESSSLVTRRCVSRAAIPRMSASLIPCIGRVSQSSRSQAPVRSPSTHLNHLYATRAVSSARCAATYRRHENLPGGCL